MEKIVLKALDETILHDVCDNGLHIYMYINPRINNFYATLNVRYGAVDTEFKIKNKIIKVPKGIAHFLEHLKFNQPNGISAHEYFSKLGSNINAFTTHDFTAYEVIAANKFNENISYLLDYVQTPHFTKSAVEGEKGIIIEEIKMYDDNPGFKLYSTMNEALFNKDNRKYLVSGTIEEVKKTTVQDLNIVYDTFYHPQNMFMVITGNFNPEEAITLIKKNQNSKSFPVYKNPKKIHEKEPNKVKNKYIEIYQNVEFPKVKICFKMLRNNFKNISDLDLKLYLNITMRILFGETGKLKEELLKNNLISGEIVASATVRDTYVILSILAETNYPDKIIKILKSVMNNIIITNTELERKKKVTIAGTVLNYDDIEVVNSDLEEDLVTYNKVITDIINHIKKMNIRQAKQIIKSIKTDNHSVVVLLPKK